MARRVVYRATATSNQHSGSHDCFCTSVFSYTTCIILRRVTWRQAEMHLLPSSRHLQPNTAVVPLILYQRCCVPADEASRRPALARAALIHQSGQRPQRRPQAETARSGWHQVPYKPSGLRPKSQTPLWILLFYIYIAEFMQKSFLSTPCPYFQHLRKSFSPRVRAKELNCSANVHTEMQSTKKWEVILTH